MVTRYAGFQKHRHVVRFSAHIPWPISLSLKADTLIFCYISINGFPTLMTIMRSQTALFVVARSAELTTRPRITSDLDDYETFN
ncbi:hypothetical protein ABKN59_005081 [Abortiporus biennis]